MGEAIIFERTILVLYCALVMIVAHFFVVRHEEPGLRKKFEAEYDAYCQQIA
jgi:protein-S-isoprenylcysteine O-methyltransferase Ste14